MAASKSFLLIEAKLPNTEANKQPLPTKLPNFLCPLSHNSNCSFLAIVSVFPVTTTVEFIFCDKSLANSFGSLEALIDSTPLTSASTPAIVAISPVARVIWAQS